MGIKEKEKSRQEVKSNISAIVGIGDNKDELSAEGNISSTTGNLTQKAYYITEDQYYKLRMLSVKTNKDMSALMREILDSYFEQNPDVL